MSRAVVWFTGLPASGKSTLARAVAARLEVPTLVVDSDELREAIVPAHGYDERGRDQFYETVARLAATFAQQGIVVLVAATAHRRAYRERARALAPAWLEVYVATDLATCAARDIKGLYRRARAGEIALPGAGVEFEPPTAADVVASGGDDAAAVDAIVRRIGQL